MKTGILRFIRHSEMLPRLAQGWKFVADLGDTHGQWSVLMWWCCGACRDGECP